jgi:hypothetical protein
MRRGAFSVLIGGFALVVITERARAQAPAPAVTPIGGPHAQVIEPLQANALPATLSAAKTSPALPLAQPPMIHQPYLGWSLAGRLVFGISYGLAVIPGLIYALVPSPPANSISNDVACDSTCKSQGALLLVPVAGPLLGIDNKVGLLWSGIQAAGLAMLIVGLVGHDVPQTQLSIESPTPSKVSVVPFITAQGGTLSMRMAW